MKKCQDDSEEEKGKTRIAIVTFPRDGQWFANVQKGAGGPVIYTTGACADLCDAEWMAMEWVNGNDTIKADRWGPYVDQASQER
jgi:hypothetical protein